MHLVDSVGASPDLKIVCNLHEQACAVAADAYGQYTNNLGVALVTTGPGGTNALTGVAAAWLDSTPCLFISGQVKRPDLTGMRGVRQMGFQEIDIVSMVKGITKYAVTITEPESIRFHLEKAASLARSGRPGPVWIDIPLDVQAAEIPDKRLSGYDPGKTKPSTTPNDLKRRVAEAITLFNAAQRPAVLLGNGVRLADAADEFYRLADLLGAPILATWKAIDLMPDDHPLYAGRPGGVGQRGANFTQQNADWLLVLGARLDLGQTGYSHKNFARQARKIMVDADPAEIGKMTTRIDVPIAADAKDFLQEFLRQKDRLIPRDRSSWLERSQDWRQRYPVVLPEYRAEKGHVNDYVLIDDLSQELNGSDLLIPGSSGACSERTMQCFRVKKGQRVLNTQGLGAMGLGIPAAIGGCIASGRRRTVCIDGDGGFQLNIQELETVRRLKLPIKFFVLNNQGYASIRTSQKNYFKERYIASGPKSGLSLPDTLRVAAAYGIPAIRIRDHSELRAKLRKVLRSKGPFLCDVVGAPDQPTMPRISSSQRPDGTMVSQPMEDLWPFLDRAEFKSNMIVPAVKA